MSKENNRINGHSIVKRKFELRCLRQARNQN
jgi:hypothetical protein